MTNGTDAIGARLSSVLGPVDHRTDVLELQRRVSGAGALTRQRLVEMLAGSLEDAGALATEPSRVLQARLLVALLPASITIVERLLSKVEPDSTTAELQFSLLVALEDLPDMHEGSTLVERVAPSIEGYLLQVREDSAQAAWMAGDLLGDHWPLEIALPVLLGVSRTATHVAGREGAIHGLSHVLKRVDKREQWEIVQTIRQIAERDRSNQVRRYANSVMTELRDL